MKKGEIGSMTLLRNFQDHDGLYGTVPYSARSGAALESLSSPQLSLGENGVMDGIMTTGIQHYMRYESTLCTIAIPLTLRRITPRNHQLYQGKYSPT